jgi:putative FmdB family regulatory protein
VPLYEYECPKDGRFEQIRKFSDPPLLACPTCGQPIEKLLSSPAIQFKGSGWYITDYARKGGDGSYAKDSGKDNGTSESGAKDAKSGIGSKDSSSKDSTTKEGTTKDSGSKDGSKSDSPPTSTSSKKNAAS